MKFFSTREDDRVLTADDAAQGSPAASSALGVAEAAFAALHAEHQAIAQRIDDLRSKPQPDQWTISESREELAQVGDRMRAAEIKVTRLRIEALQAELPAVIAAVEPAKAASDAAWLRARTAASESDKAAFEYNAARVRVSSIEGQICTFERRITELSAVADRTDALEQDSVAQRLANLEQQLVRAS